MEIQSSIGKFGLFVLLGFFVFCTEQATMAQTRFFMEHGRMVHQYGFEDGLKLPVFRMVIQGKDGYIWAISALYLIRYDGYEFKYYSLPEESIDVNNTSGFSNMIQDDTGKIWVTYFRAIMWEFDPVTEEFEKHTLLPSDSSNRNAFNQLVKGENKDLLAGGYHGLFQISDKDSTIINHFSFDTLQAILKLDKDTFPLPISPISLFIPFKDSQGNYWGGTSHGLFFKINYKEDGLDFELLQDTLNNKGNRNWDNLKKIIEYDKDHLLLLGYRFVDGKEHYFVGLLNKNTGVFGEIKTGLVSTIRIDGFCKDKNGQLWMGTVDDGLYVLEQPFYNITAKEQPNLVQYFLYNEKRSNPIKVVISITEDISGNIWVSSGFNFLYRIDAKREPLTFTNFLNYPHYKVGDNVRGGFFEDSKNNIWVSSSRDGLTKYDTKNDQLIYYHKDFKGISIEDLCPILEYSDGSLLLSGPPERLFRYYPKLDKVINISTDYIKNEESIYKAFAFDNNLLVLLGYNGESFVVNKNNLELIYTLPYHWIAFRGTNNSLWIYDFRSKDNPMVKYQIGAQGLDTLKKIGIPALGLYEDEETGVWLGSWVGLRHLGDGYETLNFYNEADGLINNSVGEIVADGDYLWIFTVKGISRLNIATNAIDNFNQLNHIGKIQSSGTVIKNNNGVFRIIGEDGFYSFHPDSLSFNQTPPYVNIQAITIGDKRLSAEKKSMAFQLGFLQLDYFQNDLSIDYVGINFKNTAKNQYQYQLEGFQKDWQKVGKDRTARFSNLPPGNYTFKVKAANADGIWSKPKSLKITILPPWWQTWWAYALYILAGVGALWWYIQSINQKLKKEQSHSQKLQTLNHELKDINAANQRFVPNDFLQILGKKSIKDLKLGDQIATQMTVLFSDIRDYTPLSESMTPEENFKFINAYLGRVGPIIKAHGGFISTYLGDGFMALFVNEPENALKAAVAAQKELENYNRERKITGKRWLKTGMGLNTGELMLGVIGDEHRYESTVISDAVNTASRMEGLTKIFGAAIILSEKTLLGLQGDFPSPRKLEKEERLVVDGDKKLRGSGKLPRNREMDFAYRYLGKVKVKGKDKAIKIYDLYEGETVAIRELKAQTKLVFEQGISYYFNRKFGKAAECFKQVLAINERDKAAQYYLDKSVGYIVNGVTENWSGVEEMVMK